MKHICILPIVLLSTIHSIVLVKCHTVLDTKLIVVTVVWLYHIRKRVQTNFFFSYNFKETILSVQYTHITESSQSVTIDKVEVKICCHGNRLVIHFLIYT